MELEYEKLNNIYSTLKDSYSKYLLIHIIAIISIGVSIFNSITPFIQKNNYADIIELKELENITYYTPFVDDWILKALITDGPNISKFLKNTYEDSKISKKQRPIYLESLPINSILEDLKNGEINKNLIIEILKRYKDSLIHQRVNIENLIQTKIFNNYDSIAQECFNRQNLLISNLKNKVSNEFLFSSPIFSSSKIDLRLWILLLPILFIISKIYLTILSIKINLIKKGYSTIILHTDPKILHPNFNFGLTSEFANYPFIFIKYLGFIIESLIVFPLILILILYFPNSYLKENICIIYYFICFYGFIFCYLIKIKMENNYLITFVDLSKRYVITNLFQQIRKVIFKIGVNLSTRIGSILILLSIFLTMMPGCNGRLKGYHLLAVLFTSVKEFDFYLILITLLYLIPVLCAPIFFVYSLKISKQKNINISIKIARKLFNLSVFCTIFSLFMTLFVNNIDILSPGFELILFVLIMIMYLITLLKIKWNKNNPEVIQEIIFNFYFLLLPLFMFNLFFSILKFIEAPGILTVLLSSSLIMICTYLNFIKFLNDNKKIESQ